MIIIEDGGFLFIQFVQNVIKISLNIHSHGEHLGRPLVDIFQVMLYAF